MEFLVAYVATLVAITVFVSAILCIPAFIAFKRNHQNRWLILVVCIAFGGTGIGWLIALIWALKIVHLPGEPTESTGGQSGLNIFANDVKRVRIDHDAAARSAAPSDMMTKVAQVEKLIALRDAGHITPAEYESMKVSLLKRAARV